MKRNLMALAVTCALLFAGSASPALGNSGTGNVGSTRHAHLRPHHHCVVHHHHRVCNRSQRT